MSTYYRTCPDCGCNLDPGEICDCKKEREFKPDIRLYGNVQQTPVIEDVLIIGYDCSKTMDMACLTVARKSSDHILILKEFYGYEAVKVYADLTTGPCVKHDPKMEELLKKNLNIPREQKSTFSK